MSTSSSSSSHTSKRRSGGQVSWMSSCSATNGFSSYVFRKSNCALSIERPELHGLSGLKQVISSSWLPSVATEMPHATNDLIMRDAGSCSQLSRIQRTISRRGGSSISWRISLAASHSSYFSVLYLKGLFQETSGAWMYLVHPPGMTPRHRGGGLIKYFLY